VSGSARLAERPVFIVDGSRTPFLAPALDPDGRRPFDAVDFAVWAGRPLLLRQPFDGEAVDEVVLGCVHPLAGAVDPGRRAALRLTSPATSGWTLQSQGASGLRAIDNGFRAIAAGRADLVLAGGAEAGSRATTMLSGGSTGWLGEWRCATASAQGASAHGAFAQGAFAQGAFAHGAFAQDRGLLSAAINADALGYRFGVLRDEADRYAFESRQRLAQARERGHLEATQPLYDHAGNLYAHDGHLQPVLRLEDLAMLDPAYAYGNVTIGNSSRESDGAVWLLLASEAACERWSLEPRARIVDAQWAALAPEFMGLGPVFAATPLLERNGLSLGDVDAWELDESFAVVVLACVAAWRDADFCRRHLGLDGALGRIERDRLNVDGGALGLGRPLGAAGARLVLHLLEVFGRRAGRWGVAAVAGGDGGAMLVEAL
jgi:acetyl-CoA C-acetyltransferase